MITDPIEALEKIAKLVSDRIEFLKDTRITLREKVESTQEIIADMDEVLTICDTVLFRGGLK